MSPDGLIAAREATLALIEGLDDDALRAQPHPELSPIGWHLGHVAYTEALWILERCAGDDSLSAPYAKLWAQGAVPKAERVRQPPREDIITYLRRVRDRVLGVMLCTVPPLARGRGLGGGLGSHDAAGSSPDPSREREGKSSLDPLVRDGFVAWMVECHEHQHRETISMVRQLALEQGLAPHRGQARVHLEAGPEISFEGGSCTIGTDERLAYDNERPMHTVELAPYAIDAAPVSVAAWQAFVADGGYERESLWSVEGWQWRRANDISAPRGWTSDRDGRLAHMRLDGVLAAIDPRDPVLGISWYEADAFARWRGARLPTEAEWEHAARTCDFLGQVWQWTATPFAPYPGFSAFPYRGYSEPYFDGAHHVLRGGSFVTHPRIARETFRNWYEPHVRYLFSGLRCARSI